MKYLDKFGYIWIYIHFFWIYLGLQNEYGINTVYGKWGYGRYRTEEFFRSFWAKINQHYDSWASLHQHYYCLEDDKPWNGVVDSISKKIYEPGSKCLFMFRTGPYAMAKSTLW